MQSLKAAFLLLISVSCTTAFEDPKQVNGNYKLHCPDSIKINEGEKKFVSIYFYNSHPRNNVILKEGKDFNLASYQPNLWAGCNYTDFHLGLFSKVPSNMTNCTRAGEKFNQLTCKLAE